MTRGANTFRQQDLTRAIKAASAAGVKVVRIEIAPDGKLAMILDGVEALPDEDKELANFRKKNGYE